jgi:hypothetical protein
VDLGAQTRGVDSTVISAHTRFLADDLLEGRGTGSTGIRLAALYLESQCRALGLEPAGSGYRQPVPLEEATILPATSLAVTGPRGTVEFLYRVDFVPNIGSRETLTGFRGPAVFVGSDADIARGRIGELNLEDRVAVTVGPIQRDASDTLIARGTVGMVHLVAEGSSFDTYVRSRGATRVSHRDPTVESSFLPSLPSVLAGPAVARALLNGMLVTADGEPLPQELTWAVYADIHTDTRPLDEENVGCLLRGSDTVAADTAIALTAHYDHLGISVPDAHGDSIYNGFSDNAAGVAMLLAIASSLADPAAVRPRHSVLLLFLTGEERGLLGSDYYVAAPMWPLDRTLAVINLDAGAPPARPVSWRLAGVDSSGLGAVALRVATAQDWEVTTSPARANSDYFPFHRAGIPAVFIIPGPAPYEGLSADSSAALRARWDRYHQASDHWDPLFPFEGLERYAEFALLILDEVDATFRP